MEVLDLNLFLADSLVDFFVDSTLKVFALGIVSMLENVDVTGMRMLDLVDFFLMVMLESLAFCIVFMLDALALLTMLNSH